ncbi:transcription factor protein [Elysia marginata]|uniref:Transcription factor protein n=1 Tax=Elysia marginata TaxID=1093978 RepID=A0AAV4IVZ4_9GAST|nr:transcription factor protein [Elysia marginata]
MPSPSLRLIQKNCGLFDTGFAGSTADAASFGVKAPNFEPPAASAEDHLGLLADFEPDAVLNSGDPFYLHTLSAGDASAQIKSNLFEQGEAAVFSSADLGSGEWGGLEDPLASLETDPLGDESLDAFINLDQLLSGDTFLDEVSEVKPVIEMTPEAEEPAISIQLPSGGDNQPLDFFDLIDCPPEVIPVFQDQSSLSVSPTSAFVAVEPSPSTSTSKSTSRKRKVATPGPIKTSMFEISHPISENVVSTTTTAIFTSPCSPELDHDYTSKVRVIEVPSARETNKKSQEPVEAGPSKEVDKQSIRRQKNNIASKRSREQRKQKFSELDREAEELIVKNAALRQKIAELEKVAREMKAVLVAKMSGK